MKKLISKIDVYPLLIILIIGLFSVPTLIKKDFGGDFLAYFIPHYSYIFSNIKNGELPYWFPYSYLGLPEMFKSELALFHPVTLTVFLIDLVFNTKNSLNILGNTIEIVWFAFLAFGGIGFYRLTSKALGIEKLACFMGALVFCLNPLMLLTMNTIVFFGLNILPWIFYTLYQFLVNTKLKYFLGLVFINYVLFATGYPYFYVYFFLAEIALTLIVNLKRLPLFIISSALSFLISAFFLFPSVYIYSQSFRDSGVDSEFQLFTSNIPTRIVNILNPMPYGSSYSELDTAGVFTSNGVSWGIFSLVYLILGFLSFKKSKFNTWLFGTFVIALFYSFGGYMGSNQFFGNIIPFVNKFRSHSISLALTMFTGCIFIAQGVNAAIKGERHKIVEYTFWGITGLAFIGLSLVPILNPGLGDTNIKQLLSVARFIFIMGTSLGILYLTFKNNSKTFLYLGVVIMLLEFYFYFLNLNGHFSETIYSKQYEKNSLIPENNSKDFFRVYFDNNQFAYNSSQSKTFSFGGYETSTYKGWYSIQGQYGFMKTLKLSNVKYFVTTNPNWQESNLNVKLIKDTGPNEKPWETFVSNVEGLPFNSHRSLNTHYIYELSDALPRFFVPNAIKSCVGSDCSKKDNLPTLAVVREKIEDFSNPTPEKVKIEIDSYKSSYIKLKTTTSVKTFIVASETWDSGWSMTINGKDEKIYQISENFRGFIIPAGESTVIMSYTPPYLIYGIITSILGILLLIATYFKFNFLKNLIK